MGDILQLRLNQWMAVLERRAVDKREGPIFLDNQWLVGEVKRLREERVLKGQIRRLARRSWIAFELKGLRLMFG